MRVWDVLSQLAALVETTRRRALFLIVAVVCVLGCMPPDAEEAASHNSVGDAAWNVPTGSHDVDEDGEPEPDEEEDGLTARALADAKARRYTDAIRRLLAPHRPANDTELIAWWEAISASDNTGELSYWIWGSLWTDGALVVAFCNLLDSVYRAVNTALTDEDVIQTARFAERMAAGVRVIAAREQNASRILIDSVVPDRCLELLLRNTLMFNTHTPEGEVEGWYDYSEKFAWLMGDIGGERHVPGMLAYTVFQHQRGPRTGEGGAVGISKIPSLLSVEALVSLVELSRDPRSEYWPTPPAALLQFLLDRDSFVPADGAWAEPVDWRQWLEEHRAFLYVEPIQTAAARTRRSRRQVAYQAAWAEAGEVPERIPSDDPAYGSPSFPPVRFADWDEHKSDYPDYWWNRYDSLVQAGLYRW